MTTTLTQNGVKRYEALVILKSAGTEQDLARHAAALEEPIKRLGGSIDLSQSLGRRKLAFRIGRQGEGHYHILRFQTPGAQVRELERLFRLNESVIRFMILSADETGGSATLSTPVHHGPGRYSSAGRGG